MTATTPTRTLAEQQALITQIERDLAVAIIRSRALIHNGEAYRDARNDVDRLRDQLAEARTEPEKPSNGGALEIPLTKGLTTLIDQVDYEVVSQFKWSANSNGRTYYARRGIRRSGKQTRIYLHRFLLDATPGMEVDHINGDTLDNRRSNLRLVTHAQNSFNVPPIKTNTSGFVGVSKRRDLNNRWMAYLHINGRKIIIGHFDSPITAAKVRDQFAFATRGEYAYLNFPEELP